MNTRNRELTLIVGVLLVFALGLGSLATLSVAAQSLSLGVKLGLPTREASVFSELSASPLLALGLGLGLGTRAQTAAVSLSSWMTLYFLGKDQLIAPYLGVGGRVVFTEDLPSFLVLLGGISVTPSQIPIRAIFEPALLFPLPDFSSPLWDVRLGVAVRF